MKPLNEILLRTSACRVPRPWGIISGICIVVTVIFCEAVYLFRKNRRQG